MSLELIRARYKVPAKRGVEIEYNGRKGLITGAKDAYLRIRLDGDANSKIFHPTDVKYITKEE